MEPQIIEPIRVTPQYRTATSSEARLALLKNVKLRPTDDESRKPNVGTTRNYSHFNEDGSFTFGMNMQIPIFNDFCRFYYYYCCFLGYEAEDGSFKEETRGIDCVARGKYG